MHIVRQGVLKLHLLTSLMLHRRGTQTRTLAVTASTSKDAVAMAMIIIVAPEFIIVASGLAYESYYTLDIHGYLRLGMADTQSIVLQLLILAMSMHWLEQFGLLSLADISILDLVISPLILIK